MATVVKDNKKSEDFFKKSKNISGEMGHDERQRMGRVLKENNESSVGQIVKNTDIIGQPELKEDIL